MSEPQEKMLSSVISDPVIYNGEIRFRRPGEEHKAYICFCYFSNYSHYWGVIKHLHPVERNYFETLKYEKRIRNYLIGRYAAKRALAGYFQEDDLTRILIQRGVFTQPVVNYEAQRESVQVGITHSEDFGGAIAFPEVHPMGIDLEKIDHRQVNALERETTKNEKMLVSSLNLPYVTALTLLWTSKESLSKVLRTGLTTPFQIFEQSNIVTEKEFFVSYFKNFTQYKSVSFLIGDFVSSITLPLKSEIIFDIQAFQDRFAVIGPSPAQTRN